MTTTEDPGIAWMVIGFIVLLAVLTAPGEPYRRYRRIPGRGQMWDSSAAAQQSVVDRWAEKETSEEEDR